MNFSWLEASDDVISVWRHRVEAIDKPPKLRNHEISIKVVKALLCSSSSQWRHQDIDYVAHCLCSPSASHVTHYYVTTKFSTKIFLSDDDVIVCYMQAEKWVLIRWRIWRFFSLNFWFYFLIMLTQLYGVLLVSHLCIRIICISNCCNHILHTN